MDRPDNETMEVLVVVAFPELNTRTASRIRPEGEMQCLT